MTKTFRDLGVHEALCDALDAQGITHPFPIQELTLPLALDGNDLIGQARTGTGKTLAFGLPLLQRIDPAQPHTQALVVTPTRELASQVHADLLIGGTLGLTSICVYGGVGYDEQIDALRGGAHVVVGTPGRLLDHLNRGILDLSQVTQLVLDEADEMLDMGFLPDVERLIEASTGEDRHTMLFSATMPTAIVRLARRYMQHPTFTRADHEQKNTAPEVTQHFFQVHRMDKPRVLARILQSPNRGGVYVFVRTKHMADRLVNELEDLGIPAIPIHGDLRQTSREQNLNRFRSGKATVLVATEVAARGLDVSGVTHVVNYDCPDDEKMYLHRIGRTARAGEAGVAVTFAEFNEADRLNVIRKAVGATDTEVLQVFSTSQELIDLFDLPEGKPWDAQVRDSVEVERARRGGTGGRSGSGSSGGGRTGRTDGRSKNARGREGRGESQTARGRDRTESRSPTESRNRTESRDRTNDSPRGDDLSEGKTDPASRGRDRSRSRTSAKDESREDTGGRRPSDARDRRSEQSPAGERVRTRTRTRSHPDRPGGQQGEQQSGNERNRRGEGGTSTRSRSGRSERGDDGDGRDDDQGRRGTDRPTEGGATRSRGGRQRARSGSAAAKDGRDDRSDEGDRGDNRGDRGSSASSERGRSTGSGRSGSGRSSGGGSAASGGRSSGSGGRSGTGGRSGGSGGRSSGSRSANNRSGGRSSRTSENDATVSLSRRGPEARGEGQPQVARRVKVEKLP